MADAAYLYDAVRTPYGRHGGALAGVRPDDLAAHVVRELTSGSPQLDPSRIDEVVFGDANQAGEDNRNLARMVSLLAGLPTSVPGATINRLCGSSRDAATQASRAIETGDASLVLVGGVESRVVPVPGTELHSDENLRRDTSLEKLAQLKPAFAEDGTVTAGNESPLNDDAGALFLGAEVAGELLGREPIALIAGRGAHAVDPDLFGIAPVETANRALARAGIGWGDVELVELNEAFAAKSLACIGEWTELDPECVNVDGGANAIGHALGASSVRSLATLAYELRVRAGAYGVAANCVGVGQGLAVVLHA
jgi:acetyl-CoA acetyltransferase